MFLKIWFLSTQKLWQQKTFLFFLILTPILLNAGNSTEEAAASAQDWFCNHCHHSFETKEAYSLHTLSVDFPRSSTCRVCKGSLGSSYEHLQKHFCKQCGHYYSDYSNTVRHKRVHNGRHPFKCPFCLRRFMDSSNKNKHTRRCRYQPTTLPANAPENSTDTPLTSQPLSFLQQISLTSDSASTEKPEEPSSMRPPTHLEFRGKWKIVGGASSFPPSYTPSLTLSPLFNVVVGKKFAPHIATPVTETPATQSTTSE
jgi:hypothetical protein